MKRFLQLPAFCILHSAFCISLADPVPVRFSADAAAPQTFQAAAYRGETLDIVARLTLRGAPLAVADGASATMHWQTNGMGAAWWTAPASVTTSGLVRARWTPAMDCGADAYRVFLGVADGGSNLSYRANMLLRMVGSPGETPNALPLPVQVLDFAKISVTNEPWSTSAGLTTNDVRAIVVAGGYTITNEVRFADDEQGNYLTIWRRNGVTREIYAEDTSLTYRSNGNSLSFKNTDLWLDSWDMLLGNRQPLPEYIDEKMASCAARTNLPPVSASATVGDLVDALNAIANALRPKEEEEP